MADLKNLYLIGGRLEGHDEDLVRVVSAEGGLAHAKQAFRHHLLEECAAEEGQDNADYALHNGQVYLTFARPLEAFVGDPLAAPAPEVLRYLGADNGQEVLAGW